MLIKLILQSTGETKTARIRQGKTGEIPSLHDNWYFDLSKQLKRLANAVGYVLVKDETPDIIEGCMIFQLVNQEQPVMAYVEVAPHNKGIEKKHERVAGCLIAYAYKLSLIHGKNVYQGLLTFRVGEEKKEDEEKLIALYQTRYNAIRIADTTFLEISDEGGEDLIRRYLTDEEV